MITESKIRFTSIILACLGLVVSLYLTWVKITNAVVLCGEIGDCDTVNDSIYSEIFGVPIALMGAVAYLGILLLLCLESWRPFWVENGKLMVFGISLIGTFYSAYLTYIEVVVLRAICPYCVVSAITITLLMFFSIFRLVKASEKDYFNN
jgi:uncharacterized membrane protein